MFCGADQVAYIAAHESGHYLGLYHTTEANAGIFDPLGDTPQCGLACDLDRNGTLGGNECIDDSSTTLSCGGASKR